MNGSLNLGKMGASLDIVGLLKTCITIKDLAEGSKLHAYIHERNLLAKDAYVGSTLVHTYAKCGALSKAQTVLRELPVRDVVTWNALIAGYAQHGQGQEALKCFDEMVCDGQVPTETSFTCVLKACGIIGAADKGKEIHARVLSLDMMEKDMVLGTSLVDMYVKCGELVKARQVLEDLPILSVVSWNALIAGYSQHGQGEETLSCFDEMLHEGHIPNEISFACVLKACGGIGAIAKGEEIHDKILSLGMLKKDIMLGNSLVDMYVKCGAFCRAQQVLRGLPVRDAVTWNALLAGYAKQGHGVEALNCFNDMLHEGHSPTVTTFMCVLKACGSIRAAGMGKEIHDKIISLGMLGKDILLGTALVDMYAKCGSLMKAQQVFEELPICDVVTWSALIGGYAEQGQGEEALKCFDDMIREGCFPTVVTFICVLKACGTIGAAAKGKEVHDKIVCLGMLEKDCVLGTTLVDMYVKCGVMAKALQVLEGLPSRDVVSWSALIAGYAEQGQVDEALTCFVDMLCEGHSATVVILVSVLKACGRIGVAVMGKDIYNEIESLGMWKKNIVLGNTLARVYARCGVVAKAQQVLEELPIQDVVTWSALIAGYAKQGQTAEAIRCFEMMQSNGVMPNSIILMSMLNACSHSGLVDQAQVIFSVMRSIYGIHPDLGHCGCMVDVFGRAGMFSKALSVIGEMQSDECLLVWVALLSSCRNWGEANIGRLAFKRSVQLDKNNAAVYVLNADIAGGAY